MAEGWTLVLCQQFRDGGSLRATLSSDETRVSLSLQARWTENYTRVEFGPLLLSDDPGPGGTPVSREDERVWLERLEAADVELREFAAKVAGMSDGDLYVEWARQHWRDMVAVLKARQAGSGAG